MSSSGRKRSERPGSVKDKPVETSGAASSGVSELLKFESAQDLREILILSTLSAKPVRVVDIRVRDSDAPGLRDYEINLLQLIEKITNGCRVSIDPTGTSFSYTPGVLTGGRYLKHTCDTGQGIGYYLEA